MTSIASIFDTVVALSGSSRFAGAAAFKDDQEARGDASKEGHPPLPGDTARPRDRFSRKKGTLQAAVAEARARHQPRPPAHAGPPMHAAWRESTPGMKPVGFIEAAHEDVTVPPSAASGVAGARHFAASPGGAAIAAPPGFVEDLTDDDLAAYKVPTFVDRRGWAWMHPACVSRYVLLAGLAARTETPNQDGTPFEAHAMGILYDSAVHLWYRSKSDTMRAQTLGDAVASGGPSARPDQNILWIDQRWARYDPQTDVHEHVDASVADSLYAALLQGYTSAPATPQAIATCRRALAALMRSESNRDSFAAKALVQTRLQLEGFMASNPGEVARLNHEVDAFTPPPPPTFLGGRELWPHPACAAAHDLRRVLARSMRKMGGWGSELEAETVADAMGWRIHMWKVPIKDEARGAWRVHKPTYERVRVFGPEGGRPKHVLNILSNVHYAHFSPRSDAWKEAGSKPALSSGDVVDCGAGGNCLYLAILGPGSAEHDVALLRQKMVDYIEKHRQIYEAKASDAVDVLWSEFAADSPRGAARVAQRADVYCQRQLQASARSIDEGRRCANSSLTSSR